ncbi:hypothetical protein [Nocardioides sp. T2.26MG-1]|uniref:hypothetical protein n=1 Tax=Nocardioides sp. T2.26MG-1 TaxID=3041166 RepID=UPI002477A0E6|nr:hypothetical protein [Nocardioides sp. T2.26MG-1]CAI9400043.1 hypothetical protein HIDPHFAB_00324 [Nocardioides sp. T2.26MG-1]
MKLLLVVILIAIAVYYTVRVIQSRGIAPAPRPRRQQQPPRVLGPDDDPDFLRDLDRRRKHPEDPEDL